MPSLTTQQANDILRSAAYAGDLERFNYALENGADITLFHADWCLPDEPPANVGAAVLCEALNGQPHEEITDERLAIIDKLLVLGVNVNESDGSHLFPLHSAAFSGMQSLVDLLFEHGARLFPGGYYRSRLLEFTASSGLVDFMQKQLQYFATLPKDETLTTDLEEALCSAATEGHLDIVQLLLGYGVSANAHGSLAEGRCTALMAAAANGHRDIVTLLRHHGADINQGIEDGPTLLNSAAQGGLRDLALELLDNGADPNTRDCYHTSPLHHAALRGDDELARTLIEKGAKIQGFQSRQDNVCSAAAYSGMKWLVEFCLEAGDAGDREDIGGVTPLIVAVFNGQMDIVRFLVERGASINHATSFLQRTPLHAAIESEDYHIAQWLIEHRADIEARRDSQVYGILTPLMRATFYDAHELVTLLIQTGADVKASATDNGHTALHLAALNNAVQSVPLLLAEGADINAPNHQQETPLSLAASTGHCEITTLLLETGADIFTSDNDDNTPLHQSAHFGHAEVVQQLLNAGADRHALNAKGQTALDLAISEGFPRVIKLLQQ